MGFRFVKRWRQSQSIRAGPGMTRLDRDPNRRLLKLSCSDRSDNGAARKAFCQSAHFWPWRPWPPPSADPAVLSAHTSHEISQMHRQIAGILKSEWTHIACDQRRRARSMRMMKWTENSRLSRECLHSLAASVTLPQRHFSLCSRQRAFRIFRKHVEG